ncbi:MULTISPECIES: hypothetical protein [Caballeronia]|uniref:hypothetical protein n=1 Tax=Caballeronia TaxID=1827195 RepID=UPI00158D065E|nr:MULTISPECIES: hypothetical protein [Caballeronia]MCG7401992.1 hypothetical protein [Caballeronia zhejiangensis]MCI1042605.1 hypothetical protein [Caballeronia zhejiangensis]
MTSNNQQPGQQPAQQQRGSVPPSPDTQKQQDDNQRQRDDNQRQRDDNASALTMPS